MCYVTPSVEFLDPQHPKFLNQDPRHPRFKLKTTCIVHNQQGWQLITRLRRPNAYSFAEKELQVALFICFKDERIIARQLHDAHGTQVFKPGPTTPSVFKPDWRRCKCPLTWLSHHRKPLKGLELVYNILRRKLSIMQREPALLKLSGAVDRYNCFTSLSVDRCFSTSVLIHSMLCYELEEEGQPLKLVRDSRR